MRYLYVILLFLAHSSIIAQGEANNWYFGQNAGINFSTTPPTALTDGRLNTLEGCTTISDATGNLLFYTDGSIIYTRNHVIMQNGTDLRGDESSTSSALIVPQPNTPNIYIVFTVDEPHHFNADNDNSTVDGDGVNDGLLYSIVDMSLDGGNGAVVAGQKNIPLITYNTSDPLESAYRCSEKITAVKSDDCDSFWVITHFIDTYYSFIVDQTGVNPTPITSQVGVTVPVSGYRRNALGYLKASPEGDKLAVAHLGLTNVTGGNGPGKVLLYDFDNTTGIVSNEIELYDGDAPYGVEFSQTGQRLYTTVGLGDTGAGNGFILQYDLSLPDNQIAASGTRLLNESGQDTSPFSAGALQLGPDGKIYRALFDFNTGFGNYLGVIDNPEEIANNVIYQDRGLLVNTDGSRGSRIGLPPFIQSIFAQTVDIINSGDPTNVNLNLCEGDTYRLSYTDIPTATYIWFIDDVQIANNTYFLDITTTGNYRLEVDLNDGSCPLIGVANVTFFEIPIVENTPPNENICDTNNDGIIQLDVSIYDPIIIGSQDSNQFRVRYFRSIVDADADSNALTQNFVTENNPQTIVARIENIGNINCYSTTSFQLEIFNTPTAFGTNPIVLCDNADDGDDTNGLVTYDLTQANTDIYNGQSSTEFTISYHTTLTGAQTNNSTDVIADPMNAVLSNTMTAVYARIENPLNPDCFDTIEISVTVNLLPVANSITLAQCDAYQDPNDGITLFNLNEAINQITGGVANRTILFFQNQIDADAGTPAIGNPDIYQNTSQNQQLFVRVTDDATSCFRVTTLDLEVSTTSASNATLRLCDDDGNEDGFREFDLTQANTQILSGINNPNLTVTYYETIENALGEVSPITTYTNTTSGTQGQDIIYARVEDNANQCFGINEVRLFVNALPDVEEQANYFLCENEISTEIDAGLPSGSDPNNFNFLWSTGEITEMIFANQPGTYTVTVSDAITGCSKIRTIEVIVSGVATVQNIDINDANDSNTVTIVADGVGDYEYAIEINGTLGSYQDSPTFTNVPPGFHTVYIRDKNGCLPIITRDISVVGFPKYFTPNGDGFHETWSVEGISTQVMANSIIYIYDRYGKLIKQLLPGGNGWDGTYNGTLMPSSQYWYRVELEDGRILKGSFSLIR
ncbi:T9SS type B sorting domain-containing protein [Aquimarina sp. 2201CG5-10]|uniref:T9SS type B sorting domain-containing protein n=1 Tax=Aquimarina callyspongiae TaxID=3098150 RepID=UPI002AB3B8B1|nr:T9SS type B sorting domain-containing protein [Aquimarina sp. 2201CG5-10]MDY8134023.1 T9SS type B sorting domain-containing protein [Aquimarina sp. 2201CG5-10]